MGDSEKISNKSLIISAGGLLVPLAMKVVDKLFDKDRPPKPPKEEKQETVTVPALYDKDFPFELDQAVDILNSCGLTAIPCKLPSTDANIKYKNCIHNQVIDSNPKYNEKVKVGALVYVKYIPSDVIEKSQKMFEEREHIKLKIKEHRKEQITGTVNKMKKKIFHHHGRLK